MADIGWFDKELNPQAQFDPQLFDEAWFDPELIEVSAAGSDGTLAINDGAHVHAADGVVLTQVHNLTIADTLHAHTADSLVLTQVHNLAIQDALHTHAADNVVLVQQHNIAIQDALHAQAADNVVLEPGGSTDLVIQDALHSHAGDNLVLTQAHTLVIADAVHAHRTDFWGPLVPIGSGDETVVYGAGTVTLYDGPAGDFWGTADNGAMITRDATFIEASVDLGATLETNKKFLGLRGSDAAGAVMFMLLTNGTNSSYSTVWRDTLNAVAGYQGEPGGLPAFHRLTRGRVTYDGTTARAYVSANGGAWTLVNERAIAGLAKAFLGAGGGGGTHTASVFNNEIQLSQIHNLVVDDALHGHSGESIGDIGGDPIGGDSSDFVRLRRRRAPMRTK